MPSLSDVAETAGVSVSTASRVLNGTKLSERISADCAARVRNAAREVGYVAGYHRRAIRSGKTETLGVAVEQNGPAAEPTQPSSLLQPFYGEIIAGVEQATHAAGYNLALIVPSTTSRANARGRRQVEEKRIDGLVLPPCNLVEDNTQTLRDSPALPIVAVLPSVETRLPSFIYDTKDAIGRLVDHLHELGHRELLYLGPEYGQRSNQIAAQRERHFLAAACRHGIKAEAWTHGQPRKEREDPPDRLAEANYREEAMERWLHRRGHEGIGRGVTGVVCFNDITAVSACRALSRHGLRVPQDISVTGFDNLDPTRMHTRLTTVDARLIDLGVQAGELVLALADGGEKAIAAHRDFCEVIEPRLVVRESTAPACIHE